MVDFVYTLSHFELLDTAAQAFHCLDAYIMRGGDIYGSK